MVTVTTQIQANVERVREEIAAACARAGRRPSDVTLIGVTKSVDRRTADALIAVGVDEIGENRVQDAVAKFGRRSPDPPLPPDIKLHMIGNLQTNKVRDVVGLFASVQSLNRIGLAEALQYEAARRGVVQDVLLEVNTAEDEAKTGAAPELVLGLLGYVIHECDALRVLGLMTIPANVVDPEEARPAFRALRALRDALRDAYPACALDVLSMGMSNDYPIAIEEGATHVRIGRALFAGLPFPI